MKTHRRILWVLFTVFVSLLFVRGYKDYSEINSVYATISLEESKTLVDALVAFGDTNRLLLTQYGFESSEIAPFLLPHLSIAQVAQRFEERGGKNKRLFVHHVAQDGGLMHPLEAKALNFFMNFPQATSFFQAKKQGSYVYAVPLHASLLCVQAGACAKEGELFGIVGVEGKNAELLTRLEKKYYNTMVAYGVLGILVYLVLAYYVKMAYVQETHYRADLEKELKEHLELLGQKSEEMHYQIFHDALTGLPNRNQLMQDLSTKDERALVLINIDEFKQINDFYGQEIGDEVLVSLGSFVDAFAKQQKGRAYKLHSDEYAVIFPKIVLRVLEKKIHTFLEELRQFVVITDDDHDIDIMVTAGAAFGRETLLAHADMALKKAKKERIAYLIYESSMEIKEEYEKNIEASKKLKRAIRDDRIVPFYQEIVALKNRNVKRYEVLMRLIGEDGSEVSPNHFLTIAKKSKLYPQLTRMMISKSFDAMASGDAYISVNISIMDILNPKTVGFIVEKIDHFPDPKRLTFEILESEGIENYKDVLEFVRQVKAKGCSIAIDDFGSGYSSFEHILNLHVDVLKIDASLIRSIDTNKNARVTVETILSFAKTLGIKTCAEFVHSKEVYGILEEMGVDYVQGYYLAKPLPFEKLS